MVVKRDALDDFRTIAISIKVLSINVKNKIEFRLNNFALSEAGSLEKVFANTIFATQPDSERLLALRRSLAVYWMVFGQSRQEDLFAYLLNHLPVAEAEQVMRNLQIN